MDILLLSSLSQKHSSASSHHCFVVLGRGLEPPCLSAPASKTGASTNFATPAGVPTEYRTFAHFGRGRMNYDILPTMKKIRIKRFDKSLSLPMYQTPGAAAFDLASRTSVSIPPHAVVYVPLNVAIEPPEGHMLFLAPRSSLHKRGLMFANSVGIGDEDFAGDSDEYHAALFNFTDKEVTIDKGDRIAQGMFIALSKGEWDEVDRMGNESRGGFGSTGQ